MSQRERDRLRLIGAVMDGKRTQVEAARLLGLTSRQVRRIQRQLEAHGDSAIVHKLRGRPSNRRIEPPSGRRFWPSTGRNISTSGRRSRRRSLRGNSCLSPCGRFGSG